MVPVGEEIEVAIVSQLALDADRFQRCFYLDKVGAIQLGSTTVPKKNQQRSQA